MGDSQMPAYESQLRGRIADALLAFRVISPSITLPLSQLQANLSAPLLDLIVEQPFEVRISGRQVFRKAWTLKEAVALHS